VRRLSALHEIAVEEEVGLAPQASFEHVHEQKGKVVEHVGRYS